MIARLGDNTRADIHAACSAVKIALLITRVSMRLHGDMSDVVSKIPGWCLVLYS